MGGRVVCVRRHIGRKFAITLVREPLGNLAGVVVLEELMDTVAPQAGRGGDLSDGQARVVGRDAGPEALGLGLCEPRSGQAEPCFQVLFAPDTLPQLPTSFHTPGQSGASRNRPANWTG
jgi:hypothetical protein